MKVFMIPEDFWFFNSQISVIISCKGGMVSTDSAIYEISTVRIYVVGSDELIKVLDVHHNFRYETSGKSGTQFYIDQIIKYKGYAYVTAEGNEKNYEKLHNKQLKKSGCYLTEEEYDSALVALYPDRLETALGIPHEEMQIMHENAVQNWKKLIKD